MPSKHLVPLVIAGATGSKKSALALTLAKKHHGEIICADSRQFYKFMRIGTASPSDEDLALVPHHGFNIIDPRAQKIDAGFFVDFAKKHIAMLQARGVRPIIVGGTGLYLRALRFGLSDVPSSDQNLVAALEQECHNLGLQSLYEQLQSVDPKTAGALHPADKYRILRALAIYRQTHKKPSELRQSFAQAQAQITAHWLLKLADKATYEAGLRLRIEHMWEAGLVQEACDLRSMLPAHHWALDVMGYQEALLVADGKLSKEQMIDLLVIRHRQYAKRQLKWFRREDFYRYKIYRNSK